MITREQNELLTRTGPDTAMGDLFRRYWIPALMSQELPRPNCPPVQVQLLCERSRKRTWQRLLPVSLPKENPAAHS